MPYLHLAETGNALRGGDLTARVGAGERDAVEPALDAAAGLLPVAGTAGEVGEGGEGLRRLAERAQDLGAAAWQAGQRREALAWAEEAVAAWRRLARGESGALLPALAMGLNNLGLRLAEVGRRDEALAAAPEGLDHLWPLFERHPAAHATVAGALLELSESLGDDVTARRARADTLTARVELDQNST